MSYPGSAAAVNDLLGFGSLLQYNGLVLKDASDIRCPALLKYRIPDIPLCNTHFHSILPEIYSL